MDLQIAAQHVYIYSIYRYTYLPNRNIQHVPNSWFAWRFEVKVISLWIVADSSTVLLVGKPASPTFSKISLYPPVITVNTNTCKTINMSERFFSNSTLIQLYILYIYTDTYYCKQIIDQAQTFTQFHLVTFTNSSKKNISNIVKTKHMMNPGSETQKLTTIISWEYHATHPLPRFHEKQ